MPKVMYACRKDLAIARLSFESCNELPECSVGDLEELRELMSGPQQVI